MMERFPNRNDTLHKKRDSEPSLGEAVSIPEFIQTRNEVKDLIKDEKLLPRKTSSLDTDPRNVEKATEKIRASVIVNAYNEESEIGRLLDSLKKSWFPGMEAIISDDGSTDRTAAIVKKYIEENAADWLVLDSHKNLGFAGAKNSGAVRARGEYLFFFDADAPIPVGLLQEDLRQMESRRLDLATHHLKAQHKLQSRERAIKNKIMINFVNLFHSTNTMAGCGGILIKKEVFQKIGGFMKPPMGIGEDVDLSKRVNKIPGVRSGMIEGVQMPVNMRRFEKHGYWRTLMKWSRTWLNLMFYEPKHAYRKIGYRPTRRKPSISQQEQVGF